MTDDERLAKFLQVAADKYAAHGMSNDIGSSNMVLARIIAEAVIELLRIEDEQRGFR